jgi:AcrR family transcriptional regulator
MPSTTNAPVRRTQRERRSEAEAALLKAATRLFAARGIDGTSLADIGEEAGFSRGLVNHHFGTKAVLVERLAALSQQRVVDSLSPSVDGNAIDSLIAIVDSYLNVVRSATDGVRAFFVMWGAALPNDAALRPVFIDDDRRFRHGIEKIIGAGQQRGTITGRVNASGTAVALVAMLRGAGAQFLIDPQDVDLEVARDTIEEFLRVTLIPTSAQQ